MTRIRPERVAHLMQREVADILQNEMRDPRVASMVTWRPVGSRAASTKGGVLTVSRGECQNPRMRKPTILGATEFSNREVMVSFTRPMDFR